MGEHTYTGRAAPSNDDIRHLASEDLRRLIGVCARELEHRNQTDLSLVFEDFLAEAREMESRTESAYD